MAFRSPFAVFLAEVHVQSGTADEVYLFTSRWSSHLHATVIQSEDGYYGCSGRREKG